MKPDIITDSILVHGLCEDGRLQYARQLLGEMQAKGLTPDIVTCGSLLDGLCKNGKLKGDGEERTYPLYCDLQHPNRWVV